MADITDIFGGGFTKPTEVTPAPLDDQVRSQMIDLGLDAPDEIITAVSYTHLTLPTTPYV